MHSRSAEREQKCQMCQQASNSTDMEKTTVYFNSFNAKNDLKHTTTVHNVGVSRYKDILSVNE